MDTRKNDWIAVQLNAPQDVTVADIFASGINASNTGIKDPDYYKNIPQVQNQFSNENGEFDEKAFNQFYESALRSYNEFADEDFLDNYIKSVERSPYDWTNMNAPVMDTSAYFIPVSDKNRTTQGLGNIWQTGTPTFSDREVAQAQKVRDENGNELDWTPNDKGGLIKALFRPSIALAAYTEDEYDEYGQLLHQKGELKLDWKGDPYTEKLGDKDSYGREIVTISDTLTKEGTLLNKFDPFDSDSLDKSIGATVMETTLKIAPWVIGSMFGATPVLGAIAATKALAKSLPGTLKAIGGLVANDETLFGENLNKWENYMARFDDSKSDRTKQAGFFNHENIGEIVATSFSQLASQRVVGSLGKYLSSNKATQTKIGKELAKVYMATTSTSDAYQAFKEAGANDRWAGIGMVATFAAMYGLQSVNYFNEWLWKDTWLDEYAEMNNVVKQHIKTLQPHLMKVVEEAKKVDPNSLKGKLLAKKWFKTVYDWTSKMWGKLPHGSATQSVEGGAAKQFFATMGNRALNEGIEETMEEFSGDVVKAFTLGLNALGVNVAEESKNLNFGFTPESVLQRYGSAFLGGAIGGAVFEGYNRIEGYKNPILYMKDTRQQLMYYYRNGYGEDIMNYLEYMHKKGLIPGNKNLSTIDYSVGKDLDNPSFDKVLYKQGTEKDNQQENLYALSKASIQHLFDVMDSELVQSSDFQVKKLQILAKHLKDREEAGEDLNTEDFFDPEYQLLLESGALDNVIWDLDEVVSRVFETKVALEKANKRFEEAKEVSEKNNAKKDVEQLTEHLKELVKEHEEIRTGQRADKYINGAFLALHSENLEKYLNDLPDKESKDLLDENFIDINVQRYAKFKYNIDNYDQLSDAYKELLQSEFLNWQRTNKRDARIKLLSDIHYRLSGRFGKQIETVGKDYVGYSPAYLLDWFGDKFYNVLQNTLYEITEIQKKKASLEPTEENQEEILKLTQEETARWNAIQKAKEDRIEKQNKLIEKRDSGIELDEKEQAYLDSTPEFLELYELLTTIEFDSDESRVAYRERVKNYYEKYNLSKRLTDHFVLPLFHYISLLHGQFVQSTSVFENGDEKGTNWRTYATVQFQNLINNKLAELAASGAIRGSLPMLIGSNFGKLITNIASDFNELLYDIQEDPFNADTLVQAFKDRFLYIVLTNSEKEGKTEEEIRQTANERWALLGITSDEFIDAILHPTIVGMEFFSEVPTGILNEMLSAIEDIKTFRSEKDNDTLLKDLLQGLSVEVNGKPLDIFSRYEAELARFKEFANNPDEYEMDPQSIEELHTALGLIKVLSALIESSANKHNTLINQYKDALKKSDRFAELDINSANLLLRQLQKLYNDISGLLGLSEHNAISLIEEQKQITYNMSPKLIRALYDYEDDDSKIISSAIDDLFGTKDVIKKWWKEYLDKNPDVKLDDLDETTYPKFVDARREFYTFMRAQYSALITKHGSEEEVGKVFAQKLGSVLSNMKSTKFKRKTDKETGEDAVTPIDAALYFLSIIGTDLNTFEKLSKEVSEENTTHLPFFSQEYAAQLTWASINNSKLFNSFLNEIKRNIENPIDGKWSETEYVENMLKLENFMMVDGVAGSGKSSGVAKLLTGVLKKQGFEIIALSKIKDRAKSLSDTIGADNDGQVIDVLDKIYADPTTPGKDSNYSSISETIEYNTEKAHYEAESVHQDLMKTLPALTTKSDSKKIVYLIDEITLLTEEELLVFNEWVKKLRNNGYEVSFIGLGDSTQTHAYDSKAGFETGVADFTYLRTPQLSVSLRKANRGKRDNLEKIEKWLTGGIDFLRNRPGIPHWAEPLVNELNDNKPENLEFIYYETEDALYGEHFVKEVGNWVEKLKSMKSLNGDPAKILILTDSKTKYNTWQSDEQITIGTVETQQGGEYDYVIVDCAFSSKPDVYLDFLRRFYTAISRSRMGSIIVENEGGNPKEAFGLTDKMTKDATFLLQKTDSEKAEANNKAYREWRLKMYGNIDSATTDTSDPDNPSPTPPPPSVVDDGDVSEENIEEIFKTPERSVKSLEEIRKEAREGNGEWAKALNEADEAIKNVKESDTLSLLDDDTFYSYLENLSDDFVISNNVEETDKINKEQYVELCKFISNFILSGKPFVKYHLDVISSLIPNSVASLICDALTNNPETKAFYHISGQTLYYTISKPSGEMLLLPIGVLEHQSLAEGSYRKLPIKKNNTIIPISSKGSSFISISEFYRRTRLRNPRRMGLYVGKTDIERGTNSFAHISYGKAFVPLFEASSIYNDPEGFGNFYQRDETTGWVNKGYSEDRVWRVNEGVIQKKLSLSNYFALAELVHQQFFDSVDSETAAETKKKLSDFFGIPVSEFERIKFSQSTDESESRSINRRSFDLFNRLQILNPYGARALFSGLFKFVNQTGNETLESHFSQAVFNLIQPGNDGLHYSFKCTDGKTLDVYLVNRSGNFNVFVKVPGSFTFKKLDIQIPNTASERFGRTNFIELAKQVVEQLKSTEIPDSIKSRFAEVLSIYSRQNVENWFDNGAVTVGLVSTYEKDSEQKFAQMLDAQVWAKLYSKVFKDSGYSGFEKFLEQDGVFKNEFYCRIYKKGESGEEDWKIDEIPDKDFYQWDIVDAMLPTYTVENTNDKMDGLTSTEESFLKSLNNSANQKLNNDEVSLSVNNPRNLNLTIRNESVVFGEPVYTSEPFLRTYFGNETADRILEKNEKGIIEAITWHDGKAEVEFVGNTKLVVESSTLTKEIVASLLGVTFIESESKDTVITGKSVKGDSVEIKLINNKFVLNSETLLPIGTSVSGETVLQSTDGSIYKVVSDSEPTNNSKYVGFSTTGNLPIFEVNGKFKYRDRDGQFVSVKLMNGSLVDDYNVVWDVVWDDGYSPTISAKIETDSNSKWVENGDVVNLSNVKANGVVLSQFAVGMDPDDNLRSITKIDFKKKEIWFGNKMMSLSQTASKEKLLSIFGLKPSIQKESDYTEFVRKINKKGLGDISSLLVENDIEASVNAINTYLEKEKFVRGKYEIVEYKNGVVYVKEKPSKIYGHIFRASSSVVFDLKEVVDATWNDDKLFVTLSNGNVLTISATKHHNKWNYVDISDNPITTNRLINEINNEQQILPEHKQLLINFINGSGDMDTLSSIAAINPVFEEFLTRAIMQSFEDDNNPCAIP